MDVLNKHAFLFLYTIPACCFRKGISMHGFLCRSTNTHIRGVLFEKTLCWVLDFRPISPLQIQSQQREVLISWVGLRILNFSR